MLGLVGPRGQMGMKGLRWKVGKQEGKVREILVL